MDHLQEIDKYISIFIPEMKGYVTKPLVEERAKNAGKDFQGSGYLNCVICGNIYGPEAVKTRMISKFKKKKKIKYSLVSMSCLQCKSKMYKRCKNIKKEKQLTKTPVKHWLHMQPRQFSCPGLERSDELRTAVKLSRPILMDTKPEVRTNLMSFLSSI